MSALPGRALFWAAWKLQLLEGGGVRDVDAPFPVTRASSRLTRDGRIVAIGGDRAGETNLWEHTLGGGHRILRAPIDVGAYETMRWSPDATRAVWSRYGGGDIAVISFDGTHEVARIAGEAFYASAWRNENELTLVSAPPGRQGWPLLDATIWSWQPPAAPVRWTAPLSLYGRPEWSPNGLELATLEVSAGGREVVLRGAAKRTLIAERDLSGGKGCSRAIELTGLDWSHDSRTLAVLGRGIGYFAAFVPIDGATPVRLFAAPVGATSCYIPGEVEWHGELAVVPLFGPDCGVRQADDGRKNALAVLHTGSGKLLQYALMSQKGLRHMSGSWAATTAPRSDDATEFIDLDTGRRITVQLAGLADYCCVP